jgi:hypothetical protein
MGLNNSGSRTEDGGRLNHRGTEAQRHREKTVRRRRREAMTSEGADGLGQDAGRLESFGDRLPICIRR